VHHGHHEVANAEGHTRPIEGAGDGEGHEEIPGHAHQHQQASVEGRRRHRVGEPGVAAVHPPDVPEDHHHHGHAGAGGLIDQHRRELGDGEDEDQVEEELDGRDPDVVHEWPTTVAA
jgi:hypothetical protein